MKRLAAPYSLCLCLSSSIATAQELQPPEQPQWTGIVEEFDARQAAEQEGVLLRLYDIADLAQEARPENPEHPANPLEGPDPEQVALREAKRNAHFQALARVVQRHLHPRLVGDPAQAVRATARGTLVVNGTPAQHAWVEEFLLTQRQSEGLMFDIQVRIVSLPPAAVEVLGLVELPRILATPEEAEALLAGIQGTADAEVLSAPRVLSHNRSIAELLIVNQVAYVSRWQRYEAVAPQGEAILDPVIEILQEGIFIESRATTLGSELMSIDLSVKLVELLEMETLQAELGEISVPHVSTRSLETSLALGTGHTAVFLGGGDEQEVVVILVRVSEVWPTEPELEPNPGGERREKL